MNNSQGPGVQLNGQLGPDYQAYDGRPEHTSSVGLSLGPSSLNPGVVNSNLGHGMNQNSSSRLENPNLGYGMNPLNSGPRMVNPGLNPNLQRMGPLNMQTQGTRHPQMNGCLSSAGQANLGLGTPSSVGSRFPMWDVDIPSQMFMQAINFDQLMGTQGAMGDMSFGAGPGASGNILNSTRLSEETNHKSEAGLDLLEQQQAMEQARLLQRFKELRHWQQQQQESLMKQQQQQLSMLRQEQQRVQTIITKQRDQQWGGGKASTYSSTATPPKFQLPPGMDMAKLMASGMVPRSLNINQNQSSQSEGGLPKPVIYVEPKDDDDEIKTNPDLFSDTNSNRGSQACQDDGIYPIPDSASEASVDVLHGMERLQAQPKLYQPRYNKRVTESPRISHHHSVLEAESDGDQGADSFQSPTLPASKLPPMSAGSQGESVEDSSDQSDDSSDEDDEDDDDDDDYEIIDENEEDEQQTTQIEVHNTETNFDEIPIKTALEAPKSFEQLLEEQLKAEEERLKKASASTESPSQPKRQFLKKGEGISRFEVKPGQRPPRPKKPTSGKATTSQSTTTQKSSTSAAVGTSESQKSGAPAKTDVRGITKSSSQSTVKTLQLGKIGSQSGNKKSGTQSSAGEKAAVGNDPQSSQSNKPPKVSVRSNQSTNKTWLLGKTGPQSVSKKTGTQSSAGEKADVGNDIQSNQSNKPPKHKKPSQKSPMRPGTQSSAQEPAGRNQKEEGNLRKPLKKLRAPESIPDDASFIASLKERQKESERDLEELNEFELLEDLADNMSFCSNSSIVTKGIYGSTVLRKDNHGLQSDRILTGVLPKASSQGKSITKTNAGSSLGPETGIAQQANLKPFHFNTELKNKDTEIEKFDENLNKNVNSSNNNNREIKFGGVNDEDDDNDDSDSEDDSSTSDDSDEYETESESEVEGDDVVNKETEMVTGTSNVANKDYFKLTHNEFSHVGNNRINISKSKDVKDESKTEVKTVHCFDKERKMLTFSDTSSEFNESESEETDVKFSGYKIQDQETHSPTKVLTRKVAVKDDRKSGTDTRILVQKVPGDLNTANNLLESLDYSAFAPKAKSPLVISKERVASSNAPTAFNPNLRSDKFVYHSDSDSNGKQLKGSFSDGESSDASEAEQKAKPKNFYERKTLQFDDDDEWDDKTPVISRTREAKSSTGSEDHDKTLVEETEKKDHAKHRPEEESQNTPPTSKLVSKLFPKLKPAQEKQQKENQSKIQTASQAAVGDGIQSKALRDKLIELEREIEKFRNENNHLAKLRSEREEGLVKLKREIAEFEKGKTEELKRLEDFKNEELKKIKHEKKMFDKYQKASRACPDKKEREEIETLKSQLTELQEEMKRKESRWSANNSRLRNKIEQLEQENEELKDEIKVLEKKRLDWLQKDQNKSKTAIQLPVRSSTPTPEEEVGENMTANARLAPSFAQEQFNDLSAASSIRSNMSLKPSHHQPKVNVRSSFPPHSKGTSASNSVQHSKNSNSSNQSTNTKTNLHNTKGNKSKANVSHNPKQQQCSQGQGQRKPIAKQGANIQDGGKTKSHSEMNTLRHSQTEDLPRRELVTTAEPQDLSIYSETDAEVSVHQPSIPRKTAATTKLGVDRSLIDKGNNDYEETQHSDGKVERVYNNGAREILFSNGTRKEISADGQSIVVSFFNGDIKQMMPDQRVVYYYADAQTTHINYPDGLEILQFPNNQIEKLYPDGTKEITFTDQTIKYMFPNGSEESIFPDGTVIRLDKNGDKTMEFPNGQREIHTQEFKKREYPDGTVKTVYPDGRQETRYSNGRLRVKDKDGNVIVDRHY